MSNNPLVDAHLHLQKHLHTVIHHSFLFFSFLHVASHFSLLSSPSVILQHDMRGSKSKQQYWSLILSGAYIQIDGLKAKLRAKYFPRPRYLDQSLKHKKIRTFIVSSFITFVKIDCIIFIQTERIHSTLFFVSLPIFCKLFKQPCIR